MCAIRNDRYPHVFQPLKIRGVTLKNRLQYSPTVVLKCSPEGDVAQEMIDYVEWQARTGVSYVTIGNSPVVHSNSSAWVCELNVTQDRCIHGINQLVVAARENGAELSIELSHAGRGSAASSGNPALAPSDVPLNGGPLGHIKPMNYEDMDYIKKQFVDCAVRCEHAGLRIIMIHCAHNNLLAQFVSPLSNKRTDEYGGSLENRMRYPLEVLAAVRAAVPFMVIELRVSAQEDVEGGLEFDESLAFMKRAQEYVDIMHVSRGNIFFNYGSTCTIPTYFKGRLLNVPFAQEVKKHLRIPVAVVGNITSLAEAEAIIGNGKADIVVMAKSFMADGDLIHKSLMDKVEDIRPCTRCDWCGNANVYGTSMRCAINPRLGKNIDIAGMISSDKAKNVMVIGGGPGGMMAAQTLCEMGHKVTLYEKADKLGGLVKDAIVAPFKEYLRLYHEWDVHQTETCGAKIVYNTEVTPELVEKENPDAIIVATGSKYIRPNIEGIDNSRVKMVSDVENHRVKVGQKVVVCGGGIVGLECAIMMGMEGKEVTVIDRIPTKEFGKGMPVFNHIEVMYQLEKYGVKLQGDRRIKRFADEGVVAADSEGQEYLVHGDTYVIALGVAPDDSLANKLLSMYAEGVYVIGDCVSTERLIADANQEAFHAALRIK
ncbi:MAG: NADH:flavin oxidoreductase, Old Yellow Enzyme family [Firmicutes bacterium]|nr:NADH:flavin oxidoreductase, Old Yellow Enzyme family [Bacillota bacterium]